MSKLVSNNSHANVSYAVSDSSHVHAEDVNAMNGFPNSFQKKYDPFSATYNEGWRDHPKLKYGPPRPNQSYGAPRPLVPNSSAQNPHTSPSLEDMLKQLATQIGQVHSQGSLPSQPLPNPKDRIFSIRLKGGDDLEALPFETEGANLSKTVVKEKKIPLAVGLSLVPKYATLFIEFMDAHNLSVGEYAEIPHCSFSIPCGIGAFHYGDCLLDLGAAVNTMPSHIYESYEFGPLSNTFSILELGDGSIIHPLGILENINIKLGDLEFATDFYITES
ncbi:uncharacterized protein LOC141631961 [Silene latifolia]|uniref:uncharacterized protein LOC141631961 n=1 Tax=Silene latifolia TaxID=37657 RepID=UPI003D78173F